ncbi:acyl-CoA reductase [Paenibacillus lacisoli]|nr:acyl-CoA reductase [Paenibacillus sp. JX-17]
MSTHGVDGIPSIVVDLCWLPDGINIGQWREQVLAAEGEHYLLRSPVLDADQVRGIQLAITAARNEHIHEMTVERLVDWIDQAVCRWLDPAYPLRQLAERLLPVVTGYHAEMIRLELKRYMRNFRRKELWRFLEEELDPPAMLDGFHPRRSGGMSRAYGPELIFHVFAGNVPGVQLWSLVMGILVKSANFGKTSAAEPLLPVLFSRTLAEVNPAWARLLAVLPWKGGSEELERAAAGAAEAVVVYGSDHTVRSIEALLPPHARLLRYGHRISLAVIGAEALRPDLYVRTVRRLAEDIALYDQQSCMSPQAVFVESGGSVDARSLGRLLAAELERLERRWPRAELDPEEAASIRKIREQYELRALASDEAGLQVLASEGSTAWTVIIHDMPGLQGSPLNRTIHIYNIDRLEDTPPLLAPLRPYLQSCGTAVAPSRLQPLASLLGAAGVTRISAIGDMTRAAPGWHHDGRFNLLDLLRFVDIEAGAEQDAEFYDPDVE